jgi:uncharacterized protein DUF4838/glycosyl hydrolase family 67
MKNLFIVGLSFLVAGLFGVCTGTELAQDGKTEYVIIQNANASAAEKFAARELRDFLEKVTGAKFAARLENNQSIPPKAIYVGWTDFAGRHVKLSTLGQEDWIIKTVGPNLILTGGRPRGTLYAVYEYLEQKLGCHWLDEFTEVVPFTPELKLPTMNIKGRPLLRSRMIYTASNVIFDPELCDMFDARNKDTKSPSARYGFGGTLYGSPNACHTFYEYSRDWQTTHPEYLAMNAKGERVRSTSGVGPGQICLTHPEARKLMLKKLRKYIIKDREAADKAGRPYPLIYCVDQNDNTLSCQCPKCKALSKREGSDSGPLLDLINFLADGVRSEFPDVLIGTLAYQQTLIPPKTIRARDNVIIRLAQLNVEWSYATDTSQYPDYFRPMNNAINRQSYKTLVNWSKVSKNMNIWDYWILYDFNGANRFQTPYVNLTCIISDMKLFFNKHTETIFVECEKPEDTSFFALKRWLGLKLMQNPLQAAKPLVKTFMSGYYGPAAEKMSEYLAYMEKRINAVGGTKKISRMLERHRPYLNLDFYATSIKLLNEAEAICGTDKAALLHVQRERIPVDCGLLNMWNDLKKKLPAGKTMPFDRNAIIKRYKTICMAQIKAFYAIGKQKNAIKKLEKQLKKIKKIK